MDILIKYGVRKRDDVIVNWWASGRVSQEKIVQNGEMQNIMSLPDLDDNYPCIESLYYSVIYKKPQED